jgi:diguanylate cyclase (GGDEF)-like protein/PAS domain S-box-containing protein
VEVIATMARPADTKQTSTTTAGGATGVRTDLPTTSRSPAGIDPLVASDGVNRLLVALIPLIFVVLLAMRPWGYIAVEPLWIYLVIFAVAGGFYVLLELHVVATPSPLRLNFQIAVAAGTTTAIVYVTGWGPAMIAAYSTAAVLTVVRNGSRTWRLVIYWNLAGIALGQLAISLHWAPSKLPIGDSDAIAVLAATAFLAMMRIAALEAEQKERAEAVIRINEERFRSLIANSSDMVALLDHSGGGICYASPATFTLLQRDPESLVGTSPESIVHPDDLERIRDGILAALGTREFVKSEFRVVRADGAARDVECVITDLRENPAVSGFVVNLHDVTERQQLQRSLEYRVHHDALTGLPNRQFMCDRLEEALARSRRNGITRPVLMFLDLDHFKSVNDRFGHAAGDALLVQFSGRLHSIIREADLLARFGGDEFVILCESMQGRDAAMEFANRALQVVTEPFLVADQTCRVGLSIGVALLDADSTASEALLHADLAMYDAKRGGESPHVRLLTCHEKQELIG